MDPLLITYVLPVVLAVIMFGLGLGLTVADFRRIAAFPQPVAVALVCRLALLPAGCLGLVLAFDLGPEPAVGMMLLAASLGGTMANIPGHQGLPPWGRRAERTRARAGSVPPQAGQARAGAVWEKCPDIAAVIPRQATAATRVGNARCSTAAQELQSQLDALQEAGCDPVFSEKISTRIKVRPEFVNAMEFARTIKKAVPRQRVVLTMHEIKRLRWWVRPGCRRPAWRPRTPRGPAPPPPGPST